MTGSAIERATLVVHTGKPGAEEIAQRLASHLGEHEVAIVESDPDLVVSLGGDGTMLRAAQTAHAHDALLLGINLGTLGYLTEIDADDAVAALDKVLAGDHTVEERMMLSSVIRNDEGETSQVGLNEVLVERSERHRLIRLQVSVNGESLGAFNADGLIVATPTGSTAYALSAGGPIVSPQADCLVLVPVSAHMLFARPFVLAADDSVEIVLKGESNTAAVTLDGAWSTPIGSGCSVSVCRSDRPLRLVRLSGPNFLHRLRTKLGLPG